MTVIHLIHLTIHPFAKVRLVEFRPYFYSTFWQLRFAAVTFGLLALMPLNLRFAFPHIAWMITEDQTSSRHPMTYWEPFQHGNIGQSITLRRYSCLKPVACPAPGKDGGTWLAGRNYFPNEVTNVYSGL